MFKGVYYEQTQLLYWFPIIGKADSVRDRMSIRAPNSLKGYKLVPPKVAQMKLIIILQYHPT
jgi:hypothetical protein